MFRFPKSFLLKLILPTASTGIASRAVSSFKLIKNTKSVVPKVLWRGIATQHEYLSKANFKYNKYYESDVDREKAINNKVPRFELNHHTELDREEKNWKTDKEFYKLLVGQSFKNISQTKPNISLGNLSLIGFSAIYGTYFPLKLAINSQENDCEDLYTDLQNAELVNMNKSLVDENKYFEQEIKYFTTFIEQQKDQIEHLQHKLKIATLND